MKKVSSLLLIVLFSLCAYAEDVTLTFMSGGVEYAQVSVEKNTAVDLASALSSVGLAEPAVCRDYEFAGWSADQKVSATTAAPTLQTSVTPNADMTLYAVFRKQTSKIYNKISSRNEITIDSKYILMVYYTVVANSTTKKYWRILSKNSYSNNNNIDALITAQGINIDFYEFPSALSAEYENDYAWEIEEGSLTNSIQFKDPNEKKWWYVTADQKNSLSSSNATNFIPEKSTGSDPNTSNFHLLHHIGTSKTKYTMYGASSTNHYVRSANSTQYYEWCFYKETPIYTYTSEILSVPATIILNACGGTLDGTSIKSLSESAAGEGIILPIPTVPCNNWEFAGWMKGAPQSYEMNTELSKKLIPAGSYNPETESEQLYAVYKKYTDDFWTTQSLIEGEKYLLGDYVKKDSKNDASDKRNFLMVSNKVNSATRFNGFRRNDNGGRTILHWDKSNEDKNAAIWILEKGVVNVDTMCALKSNENGQYLVMSGHNSSNRGTMSMTNDINNAWSLFERRLEIVNGEQKYETEMRFCRFSAGYWLYFIANNLTGTDKDKYFYPVSYVSRDDARKNSDEYFHYLFMQVKEFASYPPCDGYTVTLDPKEGTCDVVSLTESAAYKGVVLPKAIVNTGCGTEDWGFVGWGEDLVDEETGAQTFNLYLEGETYYPKDNVTLYAVYGKLENRWEKVTLNANIRLGGRYVIAYCPEGQTKKSLLTTEENTVNKNDSIYNGEGTKIIPRSVSMSYLKGDWNDYAEENYIDNPNEKYIWEVLGSKDQYYLYNRTSNKYLSIKEEFKAVMTDSNNDDNSDSLKIRMLDEGYGVSIQSNVNTSRIKRYLVPNTEKEYVRFYTNSFKISKTNRIDESLAGRDHIYLFRQVGTYFSKPVCEATADVVRWTENSVTFESYDFTGEPQLAGVQKNADGTYTYNYDVKNNPCQRIIFQWDGVDVKIDVPMLVTDEQTMSSVIGSKSSLTCRDCDVVITETGQLNVDAATQVHNVVVYAGGKLNVDEGKTLTARSLMMRFDDNKVSTADIKGEMDIKQTTVYLDRRIDEQDWYFFSLPFNAEVDDIIYANNISSGTSKPVLNSDYWVKYYDGKQRTEDSDNGKYITNSADYWKELVAGDKLNVGQGYIVGLKDNLHTGHTYHTLRFPMSVADWTTEQNRDKQVAVTASPVASSNPRKNNAGWNMIANPYLAQFKPTTVSGEGLQLGEWEWNEDEKEWDLKSANQDVLYFSYYLGGDKWSQAQVKDHTFDPFTPFMVQVLDGNAIDFKSAWGKHALPALRAEQQKPVMVEVEMKTNSKTVDRFGVLIGDNYTTDYEVGYDLQKMMGEQTAVWIISKATNNPLRLAYQAVNQEIALEQIPIGVKTILTDEYTFALSPEQDLENVKAVWLIDKQEGVTTNLLYSDYMFLQERTSQDESRFALTIELQPVAGVVTDIEQMYNSTIGVRKLIDKGNLFIELPSGQRFNAVGAEVK